MSRDNLDSMQRDNVASGTLRGCSRWALPPQRCRPSRKTISRSTRRAAPCCAFDSEPAGRDRTDLFAGAVGQVQEVSALTSDSRPDWA